MIRHWLCWISPANSPPADMTLVKLCHFHLPSRDPAYLDELRASLADAHTLDALLIDSGDLVHPTDADEHEAWIAGGPTMPEPSGQPEEG
jgi:hypothetical protein